MSDNIYNCRRCGIELDDVNWYPSLRYSNRICKSCYVTQRRNRRHNNKEKARLASETERRARGVQPMSVNIECAGWLGCHVAERVLKHVFKEVTTMPQNNKGYDFVCSKNYKVDVKSSCIRHSKGMSDSWKFHINKNTTADYFLCLAFDNRQDLTPMYLWLIPGHIINKNYLVSISTTRLKKWGQHRLDINQVISCCNTMKNKK